MECYSCYSIAAFHFTVGVRIDSPPEQNEKVISPCCRFDLKKDVDGSDMDFPATPLFETPEKTLENYMAMRARVIAKGTYEGGGLKTQNSPVIIAKNGLKQIGISVHL